MKRLQAVRREQGRLNPSSFLSTEINELLFGRDMIHNIDFRANWNRIQKRKQYIVNKSNQKENNNKSQIPHEYKIGEKVLLETQGILWRLSTPCTGPYPVKNVYKNIKIRIQKDKSEFYQKE
jgi:hypothetical protein